MELKTTDCWVKADRKTDLLIAFREKISTFQTSLSALQANVEKKTGVYVLTPEEFKKIIGDAFDAGECLGEQKWMEARYGEPITTAIKPEYINNLLK